MEAKDLHFRSSSFLVRIWLVLYHYFWNFVETVRVNFSMKCSGESYHSIRKLLFIYKINITDSHTKRITVRTNCEWGIVLMLTDLFILNLHNMWSVRYFQKAESYWLTVLLYIYLILKCTQIVLSWPCP